MNALPYLFCSKGHGSEAPRPIPQKHPYQFTVKNSGHTTIQELAEFPFPPFKLNEIFSFYLLLYFIEYSQTVFKKMFWVETQSAPRTPQSLPCSAAAAINLNRPSLLTLLPYPCSSRAWQQECNREPEPGQEMTVVCHQSFPFCCFGNDCSSESRS